MKTRNLFAIGRIPTRAKLFLAILLLTFFSKAGHSQTNIYHPFPDSAVVWNIHMLFCFNGAEVYYSITISGDTLISSQTYHKLTISYIQVVSNHGCPLPSVGYKGAIRQDTTNRKVFFVPPSNNTEQLLYNFNMQVGDSVKGYIGAIIPSHPDIDIVQSIDSVLVGSNYHKRWKISPSYQVYFIEGIGSTYGLIENLPGDNVLDLPYYSIACFKQNGIPLYPSTPTHCNLITSVNSIGKNPNQIQVFPNPINGCLTLTLSKGEGTVEIYNVLGEKVFQSVISNPQSTIDISSQPNGVYFLQIKTEKELFSQKIVIQK